jgi:Fe-Mn family superoxide dismutase
MANCAPFSLPALPYAKDALEPFYTAEIFDYHHGKHHNTYVNNLNNLVKDTEFEKMPLEEIIKASYGKNNAVFNNSAQHYNHDFFWKCMKVKGGGEPTGDLATAINSTFGDFATFRTQFKQAAVTHFGSGWAFLVLDKDSKLKIESCHDAACPIVHGSFPLMTVDVWEHSYYLLYKNDRAGYVEAFLNHLANWDFASQRYAEATKAKL